MNLATREIPDEKEVDFRNLTLDQRGRLIAEELAALAEKYNVRICAQVPRDVVYVYDRDTDLKQNQGDPNLYVIIPIE